MRPEEKRLVSLHDLAKVGQDLADLAMIDRTVSIVTVAHTLTGDQVKVFPDCPKFGQYTIEAGAHSLVFKGELERLREPLSENGIELRSKDVVIQ